MCLCRATGVVHGSANRRRVRFCSRGILDADNTPWFLQGFSGTTVPHSNILQTSQYLNFESCKIRPVCSLAPIVPLLGALVCSLGLWNGLNGKDKITTYWLLRCCTLLSVFNSRSGQRLGHMTLLVLCPGKVQHPLTVGICGLLPHSTQGVLALDTCLWCTYVTA